MRRRTVEAEPAPLAIDIDRTQLIIIDMQRDFLEPGANATGNPLSENRLEAMQVLCVRRD
jgi:hypothetical protein